MCSPTGTPHDLLLLQFLNAETIAAGLLAGQGPDRDSVVSVVGNGNSNDNNFDDEEIVDENLSVRNSYSFAFNAVSRNVSHDAHPPHNHSSELVQQSQNTRAMAAALGVCIFIMSLFGNIFQFKELAEMH
jgi:hypothetical protein